MFRDVGNVFQINAIEREAVVVNGGGDGGGPWLEGEEVGVSVGEEAGQPRGRE